MSEIFSSADRKQISHPSGDLVCVKQEGNDAAAAAGNRLQWKMIRVINLSLFDSLPPPTDKNLHLFPAPSPSRPCGSRKRRCLVFMSRQTRINSRLPMWEGRCVSACAPLKAKQGAILLCSVLQSIPRFELIIDTRWSPQCSSPSMRGDINQMLIITRGRSACVCQCVCSGWGGVVSCVPLSFLSSDRTVCSEIAEQGAAAGAL